LKIAVLLRPQPLTLTLSQGRGGLICIDVDFAYDAYIYIDTARLFLSGRGD